MGYNLLQVIATTTIKRAIGGIVVVVVVAKSRAWRGWCYLAVLTPTPYPFAPVATSDGRKSFKAWLPVG